MLRLPSEVITIISELLLPRDYVSFLQVCEMIYNASVRLLEKMKEKSCRKLLVYNNYTDFNVDCLVLPNNTIYKTLQDYYQSYNLSKTLHIHINYNLYCIKISERGRPCYMYSSITRSNIIGRRVSLYRKCENDKIGISDSQDLINGLPTKKYTRHFSYDNKSVYLAYDDTNIYFSSSPLNRFGLMILNKRTGCITDINPLVAVYIII